jgi:hypothetical protein
VSVDALDNIVGGKRTVFSHFPEKNTIIEVQDDFSEVRNHTLYHHHHSFHFSADYQKNVIPETDHLLNILSPFPKSKTFFLACFVAFDIPVFL